MPLREIQDIKKKLENMDTSKSKAVMSQDDRFSPFTPEISNVRADPKKKMPIIDQYDRTTDPYDHTMAYDHIIRFHSYVESERYRMFVFILRGMAREWMTSLLARSIGSWAKLAARLHERFISCKRIIKTTPSLLQIRRGKNELTGA